MGFHRACLTAMGCCSIVIHALNVGQGRNYLRNLRRVVVHIPDFL